MLQSMTFGEVEVARLESGEIEIRWEKGQHALPVSVYAGERADRVDQADLTTQVADFESIEEDGVKIRDLHPGIHYYFRLEWEDKSCRIVAERRVRMQGAVNFRDLGGYATEHGHRLHWGKVFRSDGLFRLKENDLEVFRQIGIRHVFDFRTPSEAASAPNRLPQAPAVTYMNLPVSRGEFDFTAAMKRITKGDINWLTEDFMVSGYIHNLDYHAKKWGRVIRHIAEGSEGATLFHCTGGKDRTGICAALILLVLGVPEETVIWDHQLSNVYIAALIPRIKQRIAAYGIDPDLLDPYLTAPEEAIVAALDHLHRHYGSAEAYLREKAGVYPEELERLRETLLGPQSP